MSAPMTPDEAAEYAAEYEPGEPMGDLARAYLAAHEARVAAEAAQALVLEQAATHIAAIERLAASASIASCACGTKTPDIEFHKADCRYVKLQYILAQCEELRDLAPASGVEALAALRAERDEAKRLMQARHREMLAADDLMRKHQSRAEAAEAERDTLAAQVEALKAAAEKLAEAAVVTRERLLSHAHDQYDGVWLDADFAEATAEIDAALAAYEAALEARHG